MVDEIQAIHHEVEAPPSIHAELVARGRPWSLNTVARLMSGEGIAAKARRKFRCATDSNLDRPIAEDLVDRRFEPGAAVQTWMADIASIPTGAGWLDLAAVEGLHSRRVVGWSPGERGDSRLVVAVSELAMWRRLPGVGLVASSDRGGPDAGEPYRRLLGGHGITVSMRRRANCWDNGPMESFRVSLKQELVHDRDYPTRASLFECIGVCDNWIRRHSPLGYQPSVEYERAE